MTTRRLGVIGVTAVALASVARVAAAQPTVAEPVPSSQGASQASPPAPATPNAPPAEPAAEAAAFLPRRDVQCADFQSGPGATWRARASVSFPGPQGPVRVSAGQTVSPGAYVSGLDFAAILQARCF